MKQRRPGRIAAILAFVAAAVVVVALAVLVVRNVAALLAALGALVIAGAAGWIAVTRRGAVRILAAVAAAAALIGGAIALVVLGAVDELVVLVLATGAFAAATRRARRGAAAAQRVSRAARPRRPILLMNPKSGGGKVERFDLEGEARRRGIEPVLLHPGDDLRALAHDAARSADVIGMAGGDGSQALVAQVAMEHDLPYVCIPAGTRNHLALDLGLNREDVVGALDAFAGGRERRIDLAFVNDRIFVNNVSLGIYAEIVQSDAYRNAKVETVGTMLPELLGPDATPFDLRFRGPDGREQETAQLVLVSNNRYVLDRLGGIGTRPRLDSGRLGILAVQIANPAQAAKLVALNTVGQVSQYEGWLEWSGPEFEVASNAPVATGIDGEAVVLEPPLRFTIVPGALTVLLPPAVSGLSPAALQPGFTVSTLRELWQLAAGR